MGDVGDADVGQDTAANDGERDKAIDVLKSAKEAQKDDPVA